VVNKHLADIKRSITALLDEEETLDMEMGGLEEHLDKLAARKERKFLDISFTNTWGEFEEKNL
jgi:regulator of replication initiation timing